MKKVLFVASVVKKHIMLFHLPYLEWFKNNGYEVHVCSKNDYENPVDCSIPFCDVFFDTPFERSPLKIKNFLAYKKIREIIGEHHYDIIHCHTPIGGVLTRLAVKNKRLRKTKVIYTAHGFHFYKGSPLKNWLVYYPFEKWLASFTDVLITINTEDYETAIRKKFKSKKIVLINGIGINLKKYRPSSNQNKINLRNKYGFSVDDFILLYAAELNYSKHQDLLIRAAHKLKEKIPKLKILLAGSGKLETEYRKQIKDLDVHSIIKLLGFRNDINKLMNLSDLAVSTSRREGLPLNVMEAMATGLPLIVTDCRGNRDLIKNNINGFIVSINNVSEFTEKVEKLFWDKEKRLQMGKQSLFEINKYSLEKILKDMIRIYKEEIDELKDFNI